MSPPKAKLKTSRPGSTPHLKFGSTNEGGTKAKGNKPLPDPSSVGDVITTMIICFCKQFLYFNIKIKLIIYFLGTFIGSLICDYLPFPKTFLARPESFFNQYFVKLGWGWTFTLCGIFLVLTAFVYCCGEVQSVKRHAFRLVVGTVVWYTVTKSFELIETYTSFCIGSKSETFFTRKTCRAAGYMWHGFDLSGHAFLLVYCSLFIREEGKALIGWDGLKDSIRLEDYRRAGNESEEPETSSLANLDPEQFQKLKLNYDKLTPIIKPIFIAMTLLAVLWDLMLIGTVLYFHKMIEKVIAVGIAVSIWYVTYHGWYTLSSSPGLPGEGLFKYAVETKQSQTRIPLRRDLNRQGNKDDVPMFMGMPLTALRQDNNDISDNVKQEDDAPENPFEIRGRRSLHKPKSYFDIPQKL